MERLRGRGQFFFLPFPVFFFLRTRLLFFLSLFFFRWAFFLFLFFSFFFFAPRFSTRRFTVADCQPNPGVAPARLWRNEDGIMTKKNNAGTLSDNAWSISQNRELSFMRAQRRRGDHVVSFFSFVCAAPKKNKKKQVTLEANTSRRRRASPDMFAEITP